MVDYLYDGSFDGVLTCIHHHYYREKANGIYLSSEYQQALLASHTLVQTDEEKAAIVYEAIRQKISGQDLQRVYKVFMSSVDNKETKLLNYVRLGFVRGSCVSMLHGDPIVFAAQEAEHKVNAEIHRMCGLIRFSELDGGILYSPIEPDHDIAEFLAEHFSDRFKGEPFIIHDKKRGKALMAYQKEWYVTAFEKANLPGLSPDEKDYRQLWKHYFDSIAIKQRTNPRCQRNLMPARYWKHLPEMQPGI